uniref:phospholipase A2 n=2 Tax=Cacopsylla melanoneura TaxID=428564 RepID=A0A8D8UY23_9HEMI
MFGNGNKDVKKSTSLTGLAKGIFGGNKSNNGATEGDTKQEPATAPVTPATSEAPGFKAGDLIRPDRLAKEAKNAVYALKPDAVDWIDWKGFPYHSIRFKNDVDRILQRKQHDVNQFNETKNTALHVVVGGGDKELVLSILAAGAELELQDSEGNTPLHIAAKKNSVSVTQALLGFGADVNVRNNNGDTPRHLAATSQTKKKDRILFVLHAVGAERCEAGKEGCTDGCRQDGTFDGAPPDVPISERARSVLDFYPEAELLNPSNRGGRVLCLDGGGIKGVVLIAQLMALERLTQRPPLECFDWIAGTSTGGILASGLAAGKPLRELMNTYFLIKDKVFGITRPFDDRELLKILKEILGEHTVMNDIQSVKLLITGTLCDKSPVRLHLFRNYASPSSMVAPDAPPERTPPLADHTQQVVWQAARSSGAAPTYFEKFDRFMDGGLIANNPTLDTLTEIHERNLALKRVGRSDEVTELSVVVSLGCGMSPVQDLDVDIVWPDDPLEFANNVLGIVKILNILSSQTTNPDNAVVDRARAWCSMINVPYYRFSPTLHEDVDLATKDDKVLATILWETRAYMYQRYGDVKTCAQLLAQ